MGTCGWCNTSAGLLKKEHDACREAFKAMTQAVATTALEGTPATELAQRLDQIGKPEGRSVVSLLPLRAGWEVALNRMLEDGVLTAEEEQRLLAIAEHFQLDQDKLGPQWERTIKAAVLRDLMEGKLPTRIRIEGLPINLQKGEQVVWAFQGTEMYEQRSKTVIRGGSQGMSIRIARGVYYRPSAFAAERVQRTENVSLGMGVLVVTTKHLYFAGPGKSVRIPHTKVVSYQPYGDGIGVHRDGVTVKPQVFITGDGWFTYNLVSNVAQLQPA